MQVYFQASRRLTQFNFLARFRAHLITITQYLTTCIINTGNFAPNAHFINSTQFVHSQLQNLRHACFVHTSSIYSLYTLYTCILILLNLRRANHNISTYFPVQCIKYVPHFQLRIDTALLFSVQQRITSNALCFNLFCHTSKDR